MLDLFMKHQFLHNKILNNKSKLLNQIKSDYQSYCNQYNLNNNKKKKINLVISKYKLYIDRFIPAASGPIHSSQDS